MVDMFNLTADTFSNQIFTADTLNWQVWNKPTNAKMVYIFCLGGGGGGGGGRTSAINSSTGGGGGASSGIVTGMYQAILLPDTLYLQVGPSGTGGAAGADGTNGGISYVSYRPNTTAINILLQSSATVADGGNLGGASVQGAGGTAATLWNPLIAINGNLGIVDAAAGQNGTAGTTSGGTIVNLTPNRIVSGGSGGGGTSAGGTAYNGGSILGSGFLNTLSPGISNSATTEIHGANGYNTFGKNSMPNFFTGGSGGGPATTSGRAGGKGGNGAYGSGGGGGGGAYSGAGGSGGHGGDGIIIIACS
jgi:hypothetical protein